MSPHDDTGVKLPDEKICELVTEAGYSGMAIDLGASDVKKAYELQPIMEKLNLIPLIVAFPKTIEATELNQGTNNEIVKTSVSFSFRYWQTLDKKDFGTYPLSNAIFDTISGTVERTISANLPKIISKFI